MTTMNNEKWTELQQAEDMAYFKADICLYSPESYTIEEKKEISNDMISTSKAVLDALRADFQANPPEFRSKLLAMICEAEPERRNGSGTSSLAKETRCTRRLRPSRTECLSIGLNGTCPDSIGHCPIKLL